MGRKERNLLVTMSMCVGLLTACEEESLTFEGPFRMIVTASVEGGISNPVGERERLDLVVGETLLVRVQVVDVRERPAPVQIATTASTSDDQVVLKTADFFNSRSELMEFVFEAVAEGNATLAFANGDVGLTHILVARVGAP